MADPERKAALAQGRPGRIGWARLHKLLARPVIEKILEDPRAGAAAAAQGAAREPVAHHAG